MTPQMPRRSRVAAALAGAHRLAALGMVPLVLLAWAGPVSAHAPSVASGNELPATAQVLEDPTLSRAIGATIASPGEVDWYRMDLGAGDPLVVEMTAPDAAGGIAARFTILGPGLPRRRSVRRSPWPRRSAPRGRRPGRPRANPTGRTTPVSAFSSTAACGRRRRRPAPTGSRSPRSRPGATGKYVLAPGVREAFGPGDLVGYASLAGFFADPWPADSGLPGWVPIAIVGASIIAAIAALAAASVLLRRRSRQPRSAVSGGS